MIIVVDTTKAGGASNTFVLPIIKAVRRLLKSIGVMGQTQCRCKWDNTHVTQQVGLLSRLIQGFGGLYFNDMVIKPK